MDTLLKISDLQGIFFATTAAMMGLDPTAAATQSIIRQTWPQAGAPGFTINSDWVFLSITPATTNYYNKQREVEFINNDDATITQRTTYTRVWTLAWQCYGPNSSYNAMNIRDQLFYETSHNQLAASNLYLMTDVDDPVRGPEQFMGQWWERSNLQAEFYEAVTRDIVLQTIGNVVVTKDTDTLIINP